MRKLIDRFLLWMFDPRIRAGADGCTWEVRRFGRLLAVMPRFAGAAVVKRLARGWVFEVESATPGTFVALGGVHNFSTPRSKTSAPTTDFNSGGNATHLPAERGRTVTVDAFFMEDNVTPFARDPGQARVETLSDAIAEAGLAQFRWTSPSGKKWTATGSFNITGGGGGNNDATTWSMEFEVSGATVLS